MTLVCPECGSSNVGTREQAEIWQPAIFTLAGDDPEMGSGHEDAQGRSVDVEWEAYDSDDVGDTDTVGFFCRGCVMSWDGMTVPFITAEEYAAKS